LKVVCVTGMPACGKEEFLKVAQSKGFAVVRMGDVVREEAAKRGFMKDPDVGRFADQERKEHGYGIWAERTLPGITDELCLVDGLRGPAEMQVYRAAFPRSVFVVAIHASPAARIQRILKRKRKDDPANESEFRARDKRELSWGLGEVIALADQVIVNEGDLDLFRNQANAFLDKILFEGKS